ncbi:MAG: hypothetical protein AAB515_02320 [Patescibacteria group bacterium]
MRETAEEYGITVIRVGRVIYEEEREWIAFPDDTEFYDLYRARYYEVETEPITNVRLSCEHSGSIWLTIPEIARISACIRPRCFAALQQFHISVKSAEITVVQECLV